MSIDRNHPALRMTVAEQREFAKACIAECPIETLEKINWLLVSTLDPGQTREIALQKMGVRRRG